MWRRVRGGGRDAGERFNTAATPSAEPKAAEVPGTPSRTTDTPQGRGRKVTFNCSVRVVLVPSTKELSPLNEQLWWGADDYLAFSLEYILARRSAAAAAASKQRDEQQQPPLPPHADGPYASAASDATSAALDADESTNRATSLPSSNPGAAEAAIPGISAATMTAGTSGGHEQQEVPDGHVLSTSNTPSSEPNGKELSRPPRLNGSVPPFSPSRPCVINTTKKWTLSAGMMAAKAAAEDDEEGYQTESVSSASDSSSSSEDEGGSDSDNDPQQEHRGPKRCAAYDDKKSAKVNVCPGRIKKDDLVVKDWIDRPLHLIICSKREWRKAVDSYIAK
eukprot:g16189.t1